MAYERRLQVTTTLSDDDQAFQDLMGQFAGATSTTVTAVTTTAGGGTTRTATTTGSTTAAATTTTTVICSGFKTACACGATTICAWASLGTGVAGAGICFEHNYNPDGNVACDLCSTQAKCPKRVCLQYANACDCAASAVGCVWDILSANCSAAVPMGPSTPCAACPTQPQCNLQLPSAIGFAPPNEGTWDMGLPVMILNITFDRPLAWCVSTGSIGSFFCNPGTMLDIPKANFVLDTKQLRIDLTSIIQGLPRTKVQTCGVVIQSGKICDAVTQVGFGGVAQGQYLVTIKDAQPPVITSVSPSNGNSAVPADATIAFTFNKPVILNPTPPVANLIHIDFDQSGQIILAHNTPITMSAPAVTLTNSVTLNFALNGNLRVGWMYTLVLPAAAVVDQSGNSFAGLSANQYTFKVGAAGSATVGSSSSGGGSSIVIVLVVVAVAVVVLLVTTILVIRWLKMRAIRLAKKVKEAATAPPRSKPVSFVSSEYLAEQMSDDDLPSPSYGSTVGPSDSYHTSTSNSKGNSTTQQGEKEKQAPSYRAKPGSDRPASEQPSGGNGGTWAQQRPATGGPSAKVHPNPHQHKGPPPRGPQVPPGHHPGPGTGAKPAAGGGGNNTGTGTGGASAGGGGGASGGNAAPPPAQQAQAASDNSCPEVKNVEKQLRAMMDQPLPARKKAVKELLVEYHPDKNSAPHAKEVFQYVNNARDWFLAG